MKKIYLVSMLFLNSETALPSTGILRAFTNQTDAVSFMKEFFEKESMHYNLSDARYEVEIDNDSCSITYDEITEFSVYINEISLY